MATKNEQEQVAAAAVENTAKPKAASKYPGVKQFVYLGPTLPGSTLRQNQIICGTYEEICNEHKAVLAVYPIAKSLLIPISKLAQAKRNMAKQDSLISNNYTQLARMANEQE